MQNEDRNNIAGDDLNERLTNALFAAVEREEKVNNVSSWWRDIREGNNFRKSLEELFSGE